MESNSVTAWHQDKALWVAIFHPIALLIAKYLGVELNPELLGTIAVIAGGYIVGTKAKSGAIAVAEVKTAAAKDVAAAPVPATAADALKDAAK